MRHLIICREYPPAPLHSGGIGTYVFHISRLLAESGETVFVVSQLWSGAKKEVEEKCDGKLIIHRIPFEGSASFMGEKLSSAIKSVEAKILFKSDFYPQCFSWLAGLHTERLVEQEGIDVIEAQEFEAPLYYFQIRRALGLGPKRQPPCIVHLHSPMEFIVRYNDWDIGHPYFLTAKRLEDYSIAAADALLCPSRHLAQKAKTHYGLTENSIRVIPLPIGDNPMIERKEDTWEHGTICYVGRLERRKGVIEWIDAAVTVAHEYPTACFEFIGANTLSTDGMSGEELVWRRIPEELRMRFHFRGQQNRSSLQQYLAKARIAVVPSRWENFPNACVEAMCSGLPVIASREGGMIEMIEDGKTGWLANGAGNGSLAEPLKRALETSPKKIAEMGRNASISIRQICDNKKILENHLAFRNQVVNQGLKRSFHLPANLPWAKRPLSETSAFRFSQSNSEKGIAVVVTCFNTGQFLDECLQSIEQQTRKPVAVVIVDDNSTEPQTLKNLKKIQQKGWQVIQKKNGNPIANKNTGIEVILNSESNPLGFSFLSAKDRLQPDFIATCESVLLRCPEVGLVSCWVQRYGACKKAWVRPCPSFPYQWISNEVVPFSVVRTEALKESGNFRHLTIQEYEDWDLFNAVMAAGWVAVTLPKVLGYHWVKADSISRMLQTNAYSTNTCGRMHNELFKRFPDLIARDSWDIILLTESNTAQLLREMRQTAMSYYNQGIIQWILRKVRK